ncbi:MAG TPA: PspC domain-containing protein [Acidimicrobiales bacterium]|nr:PspC domain-containing protein [Acidimicrobiales bacterium]
MERVEGPLRRSTQERMVGGVAGGLSQRFGVEANLIRLLFTLVSLGGGAGLTLYVAAWLVVPRQGTEEAVLRRALARRGTVRLMAGLLVAVLAVLVFLAAVHLAFATPFTWPVALSAVGLVLVWRGADDEERAYLRDLLDQAPVVRGQGPRHRWVTVLRVLAGLSLLVIGIAVLAQFPHPSVSVLRLAVAVNVVIVGILMIFGPWWLRLARDLADERRERVRTEERANVAAAVHDSVLQTLALIQRAAADPREVTRLARAQERELRAWLFEGRRPGSFDAARVATVAEAVAVIETETEADHGLSVQTVVVGDCPLDEDLRALLAAGREAVVNAAKWSGAPSASLFVEVEAERVSVFVRDRGAGFDPAAVLADRRGIAESIRGRMTRHGGTAVIRSEPGRGTEVELVMPRGGRRP